MSAPSVSVIIPAYRAATTIARALESVLAQSVLPHEVLVVNDGSPDDLAAAVAPFQGRSTPVVVVDKANGGVASARNLGIERSGGDLIAFLDADDYWESHKLQHQLDVLARHPQVGFVAGAYFTQEPGRERTPSPVPRNIVTDRPWTASGSPVLDVAAFSWTSTVLLRRAVLAHHRFERRFEPAEDRDLWARMAAAAPVYVASQRLATAVLEPESLSRSDVERGYSPLIRVIDNHAHLIGPRDVRRQHAKVYRGWASAYLSRGKFREAIRPAWRRVCRQPLSAEAWWVFAKATALSRARGTRPAAGVVVGEGLTSP
jgi:glycosyltransferase involved in cell wall biosynthesis